LNDKLVGPNKPEKNTHKDWFSLFRLKSDQLQSANILSANKVAILHSVDLLYYMC